DPQPAAGHRALKVEGERQAAPPHLGQAIAEHVEVRRQAVAEAVAVDVPASVHAAALPRGDLKVGLPPFADDGRFDGPARRRFLYQAREGTHAPDALAIEGDDHVGLPHARLLGRTVGPHLFDYDARILALRDLDANLGAAAGEHHEIARLLRRTLRLDRRLRHRAIAGCR